MTPGEQLRFRLDVTIEFGQGRLHFLDGQADPLSKREAAQLWKPPSANVVHPIRDQTRAVGGQQAAEGRHGHVRAMLGRQAVEA